MYKTLLLVPLMAVVLTACDHGERKSDKTSTNATNTEINVRDRDATAVTPFDQNENAADRQITQAVRSNLMKVDDLSFNAKNIKIVTQNGKVTLRGPVANDKEKVQIADIVSRVSGVTGVDNQLDIQNR